MADSEISTTLPFVTRRHLLMGTAALAATLKFQENAAAAGALASTVVDPALALWHDWQSAYERTAVLCRKQQNLETQLIEAIGFPRAEVHLTDENVTVTVSCAGDLEELFGDDERFADLRALAEADLAAHRARWDAEDRQIGYSAAKRAQLLATDREQELADALMSAPATTLSGVAGKLDAILCEGESAEDCTDFPWPELRAALVDLMRMVHAQKPSGSIPGSAQKTPYPRKRREDVCMSVMMYQRGDRVT
ncbi:MULTISPECIES: hypothetical protein [unclassified Mesorhizobium]|uniref:hypothetical protein n=1 Tax=unclassified Mesorhizobium TaxID=325217 RepID=UPI0010934C17|nr:MULTISPECIES: hypothetical protein [unclassified Mesorhizobium]TGT91253.1 hypothetical protein EN804_08020 [Mesorhizobium sp. M8A.F.Ca.ET.161.01.1.1]TGV43467.1 hypothetical protein EN785_05530 [Mesorhizobium sp. M8A.F.Ca.ET.142.01.1.1]